MTCLDCGESATRGPLEKDPSRIIIIIMPDPWSGESESKPGGRCYSKITLPRPLPSFKMSQLDGVVHPVVDSTAVFKNDIFKNKVLFCTGGGSGICRVMTEAIVS
jgi:hypothetical protein